MKRKVPACASRSGFGHGVSHDPQGTTRFKARIWHQSVGAIFIGRFDTAHMGRLAYDYAVYSLRQQLGRHTRHATNYGINEACANLRPDVQQQIAARLRAALRQRAALPQQQQQPHEALQQACCGEQQQGAQSSSWHAASGPDEPRSGCEQKWQQQVAISIQGMATCPSEAVTSLLGMSGMPSAESSHSAVSTDCSGPTHGVSLGVATLMDAEAHTAMLDELLAEYAPELFVL